MQKQISLSIVSHGQAELIHPLLANINEWCGSTVIKEVIITCNIPEIAEFKLKTLPLKIINNNVPKGFGENHNEAFKHSTGEFFCVINPDIRLNRNPFIDLLKVIVGDPKTAVVGPRVINSQGALENNARPFPNLVTTLKKAFGSKKTGLYLDNAVPNSPDWIAGMFMLFNSKAFREVGGFDERYFLYYEDADICARLRNAGWDIGYCRDSEVIHDARRDSHRKLRYLKWHVSSMIRFLTSSTYRAVKKR
jgi:N-acetylglucosaminyl-diphospho-decaprenol L-rhamnosyltransferase